MCTEVEVRNKGTVAECETMGQLAAALGVALHAVPKFGDFVTEPSDCLCNVRWEKVAGARKATDEEGWPFPEYIIEQPNA